MGLKTLQRKNKKYIIGKGLVDDIIGAIHIIGTTPNLASDIGKIAVDTVTTVKNIKDLTKPKNVTLDKVIKEIKGKGFFINK